MNANVFLTLMSVLFLMCPPSFAAAKDSMPEPLISETTTDIDGVSAGEVEMDLTGNTLRQTTDKVGGEGGVIELEWRASDKLGLGIESEYSTDKLFSFNSAASWSLLHDLPRDFHLQAEVAYKFIDQDGNSSRGWEDSSLPFTFGLKAGLRKGRWTVRAGLGGEAFGSSAHTLPARTSIAGLYSFGEGCRVPGFVGSELIADWGRQAPFLIVPTVVLKLFRLGVPLSLGIAAPFGPAEESTPATYGFLIRLMYEFDKDD